MFTRVDSLLNRFTLYRVTLYYLAALVIATMVVSVFGSLPYHPLDIFANAVLALGLCFGTNYVLAKLFHAHPTLESSLITALILVLIVPSQFPQDAPFMALAAVVSIASKYLLTIEKQHVFNPAAVAIAGIGLLFPTYTATWWVGSPVMLPIVVVGGFLALRKMRRERLVFAFLLTYVVLVGLAAFMTNGTGLSVISTLQFSLLHSAVLFFAVVMLPEPSTLPPTKPLQTAYGMLVSLLYATPQFGLPIALTPEAALCIGNVFSYLVKPKYRMVLRLRRKRQLAPDIYSFEFDPDVKPLKFAPGQYMEWTLPHNSPDSRGNRRYFSIASAPTERIPMILVKVSDTPSSYKSALLTMKKGDTVIASRLAGDFVLPKKLSSPLALVAGGVGISPFRSMARHILDKHLRCDITLLYVTRRPEDIVFGEMLEKARGLGLNTVYVLTDKTAIPKNWQGGIGHVTADMLEEAIPDYDRRRFYIAGPQPMVQSCEILLHSLGFKRREIVTDYFLGYTTV